MFTNQIRLRTVIFAFTSLFALATQLLAIEPDANLTLDASTVRYSIQGLGGNYVFGGLANPITAYTLSHLPLAFSRVQMQLENLKPFSDEKDLDAAALRQITEMDKPGSGFFSSMKINAELARRKIPCIISIWRLPAWMYSAAAQGNGNRIAADKWPVLLAAIAQYLKYSKDKYGFEPIAFSFNEPDMGVHVKFTAEEHRDAIKKIGAHLAEMKLKTRMVLGDVVHPSATIKYLNPTVNDPEALKYCAVVSFHSWGGASPKEYALWPALASRLKLPLIVAEAGPNSRALKDGSLNTPKHSLSEMKHYQELFLYACPNAVIHWEYTPDFRLLDKDPADPKKLVPNFRCALQKHWLTFVVPNSKALKTDTDQPAVLFTAFQTGKNYTLQISNNGPARKANLTGLPANLKRLNKVTSELSNLFKQGEAIQIKDGKATIDLPAESFTTLTTLNVPKFDNSLPNS
ncbi:MAG: hypothetical protein NT018_01175 [Armatimonadetes bacterium]|nr:hypothetical protein [Armatimonadota bacterium]